MSDTPKATRSRARTLSLNQRLTKRLSSPQKRTLNPESSHSTVISLDSKDCTPPHKKLNLDDSYDSPTNYENNHSPLFQSQTFYPDSPEVGWRWTPDNESRTGTLKSNMPDSGISSKSSSSAENTTLKRLHRERSKTINATMKNHNKTRLEISQLHRADKIRTDAILRERLSKLEEQLKTSTSTKTLLPQNPIQHVSLQTVTAESDTVDMGNFSDFDNIFDESLLLDTVTQEPPAKPPAKPAVDNLNDIDDFFNDSDADSFLIAATQQVESSLPQVTQPKVPPEKLEKTAVTPKSNKEKRSSLYMKFLEDDEDDLFASLDDVTVLKASQSSKLRGPFQRYKSMPAAPTSSTSTSAVKSATLSSSGTKMPTTTVNSPKPPIKRHTSSHAISPATANVRGRQFPKRD